MGRHFSLVESAGLVYDPSDTNRRRGKMFSGIVSDHWSQATFHKVGETIDEVIEGLQVYLDEETSLEGVEAFAWDESGVISARLGKEKVADHNAWVWRAPDGGELAIIFDDHRGRRLRFHGRPEATEDDGPLEMEWDDDVDVDDEVGDDEPPTLAAVMLSDENMMFMMGSGDAAELARQISSRIAEPAFDLAGGVWRLADGRRLMSAEWHDGERMRWKNEETGRSFLFRYEDCLGTMDDE